MGKKIAFILVVYLIARRWRLNHALRDAQNECALTKVRTVPKGGVIWKDDDNKMKTMYKVHLLIKYIKLKNYII